MQANGRWERMVPAEILAREARRVAAELTHCTGHLPNDYSLSFSSMLSRRLLGWLGWRRLFGRGCPHSDLAFQNHPLKTIGFAADPVLGLAPRERQ